MQTLLNSGDTEGTRGTSPIQAGSSCALQLFSKGTEGTKDASNVIANRIPGETERPKFVVFDDGHEEGDVKYRPGVWRFGVKQGKTTPPPTLTQEWICSPLHVDALTTDAHDGNYGRLLRI